MDFPSRRARTQLLIERNVQFSLSRQLITHWLILVATTTLGAVGLRTLTNFADQSLEKAFWEGFQLQISTILVSLALVPFFIFDSLRLSNRFAGPMVRMRKNLKSLADGEVVPPIVLRKKDYWLDVAEQFNRVRQLVLSKRESNGVVEQTASIAAATNPSTLSPTTPKANNATSDDRGPESLNSESDSLWNNPILGSAVAPSTDSPVVGNFLLTTTNDFGISDVPPTVSHR